MHAKGVLVGWGLAVNVIACGDLAAQVSTADTLEEVGVRGERQSNASDARAATFSPGLKTAVFDSAILRHYAQQTVATLLAEQSSVFVKSYGFNSLATLNFRGASAAQSLVLWNGVPLQNAALGLADVSLLPVSLLDKVSVLYGASAGLWGSGAVSGAVLLESDSARIEKGYRRLDASASVGSFGQHGGLVRGDVGGRRLAFSIRAFGQQSQNNFLTPATLFSRAEKQSNAALAAGGTLLRVAARLSSRSTLEAQAWAQQYDREIPKALFEASSMKYQIDRNLRGLLRYSRSGRVELGAKLAGFADRLQFDDAASRTHTINNSFQAYGETSARWKNKSDRLDVFLLTPTQLSWMRLTNDSFVSQQRIALSAVAKLQSVKGRLEGVGSFRIERIDDRTVLLPGVNVSFKAVRALSLRGAIQRTYRAPTLNELYYNPGGNPRLKPEQGWGSEIGYSVRTKIGSGWIFRQEATAYYRDIQNWILWFGNAIWTPHNIAAVRSRGVELDNRLNIPLSREIQLSLTGNAAYARATTEESDLPGDGSIGKQLPYTPKALVNASATVFWKKWYFGYHHLYTGIRYVTTDESFALPAYRTGNLTAMWDGSVGGHASAISFRLANIWNEGYTIVAGRPMPGRHFLATVRFGFL